MGRGSGHKETKDGREASIPLQIALSCEDEESLLEGQIKLTALLDETLSDLQKYSQVQGIESQMPFYKVIVGHSSTEAQLLNASLTQKWNLATLR